MTTYENTKLIALTQGKFCIVDECDFEWLNQWKWCLNHRYAARSITPNGRKPPRIVIWMHRIINNTPEGMQTDHINGDGLDNRKENLRAVTQSQNNMNRKPKQICSSKYKGVHKYKANGKFTATIQLNGKQKHLGYFFTEIEAAIAYNLAAAQYFGEFARTNIIEG